MDLAFMADKGGVGKSLLAYHVATRLKQLGHDVALIDLDQRSASSRWAGQEGYVVAYDLNSNPDQWTAHKARVWDTPAHSGPELRASLLDECDQLVVVAASDAESHVAAMELWQNLTEARAEQIALVVNNILPASRRGEDLQDAFRSAGATVLDTVVRRYACYEYAQLDGRAVCDYGYAKADEAWSDISALTAELLTLVENRHAVA